MNTSAVCASRYLQLALLGIVAICCGCGGSSRQGHTDTATAGAFPTQMQANAPLSTNDISWLFPVPTRAEDFANLIAVRDITTPNAQDPTKRDPVWTDATFQQFLTIVNGAQTQVAGTQAQISLPQEARVVDAWFVAGIRIDAGAPGLSNDIRAQFGQLPEIRLIVQPIIKNPDGSPKVLDIAGHLIFDFVILPPELPAPADCFPRFAPDVDAFNSVVADVAALRTKLSNGQLGAHAVSTAGVPLGVHPGLADAATANAVRNEMLALLERHISAQRLGSMAIAGLPASAPAPWIFLSIVGDRAGHFFPAHGPTLDGSDQQFAQMLNPAGTNPRVVPEPHTNNLNPITCKNAAVSATSLPIAVRRGVATFTVFATPAPPPDQTKQILDTVADPTKSFFFNTDCVSCHTETRRTMDLLSVTDIPGINKAALPNGQWDVRNFGWGDAGKAGMQATVTRRTTNETAASVAFINAQLAQRAVPSH
jgi:mono/diheme cytochrome c family protein